MHPTPLFKKILLPLTTLVFLLGVVFLASTFIYRPTDTRSKATELQFDTPNGKIAMSEAEFNALPQTYQSQLTQYLISTSSSTESMVEKTTTSDAPPFVATISGAVEKELPNVSSDVGDEEGTVIVSHADNFEAKTSADRFFVSLPTQEVLELDRSLADTLVPGAKVRINRSRVSSEGKLLSATLVTPLERDETGVSFSRDSVAPAIVTGSKRVIAVIIDFPNLHATTPSSSFVSSFLRGTLTNFMSETSYGKLNISGDAVGIYRASINATCDLTALGNAAVKAADPYVNFKQYTHLVVINPGCNFSGQGWVGYIPSYSTGEGTVSLQTSSARNDYMTTDASALSLVSHELGHNFGAWHANGWDCATDEDNGTCKSIGYADHWDTMGNNSKAFHYDGYHKQLFGWLPSTAIQTVTTSGRYTIQPIENVTTLPQILKIKRSGSSWYYIENHIKTGFDSGLSDNAVNGAQLRLVPTFTNTGDTHVIDATPNSISDPYDDFSDANWPIGKTFIDPRQGIQITPVGKTNGVLTVDVTFIVPPNLLSPTLGSTSVITKTPVLDWDDTLGAQKGYAVQLSTVPTFASTIASATVKDSQYIAPALKEGVNIYWRVRSLAPNATSAWSPVWNFLSADPPTVPVLKTPATNTLFQTPEVSLTWGASTAPVPDHYEVQVSTKTGADFDSGIIDSNSSVSLLSYTTKTLPRGYLYYWRVRAISAKGEISPWSAIWSFKIAPSAPSLISPTNGSTSLRTLTPTFDWSDSSGATNYYIQASKNSSFTSLLTGTNNLTNSSISTYTTPSAHPLPANTVIYWRVYTVSPAGKSSWSAVYSFTTPPAPPTVPVLSTPANTTTIVGTIPSLTWKASSPSPAVSYDVELSTTPGTSFDAGIIQTKKGITTLGAVMNSVEYSKTYYWRVKAYNSIGNYSVSAVWSFKTKTQKIVRLVNIPYGSTANTLVDGFVVDAINEDGVITEQTSNRFNFQQIDIWPHWMVIANGGTWTKYSGGDAKLTRFAGDYVEFTTTATSLKLYTRRSDGFGKFEVYVNGVKKATLVPHATSGDVMAWMTIPL